MTRDARRPGTRGRATTQLPRGTAGTRQEPDARPDGLAIARGETLERVLFRGSRTPMDRRELHVALEPIVRAWLDAACTWDNPAIGDYRFVIFSLEVAPDVVVYVQFWSEPFEPVLWEVSSGRPNPPADEWLAGERARRIEAMGFTIGGESENYQKEVAAETAADLAALSKAVVRIFSTAFDYRGTRPISVRLTYEGRSETRPTYDGFSPEDVSKVFAGLRFRVEEPADADSGEPAAVIRCRKRGLYTLVEFDERVKDENLYRRVRFSADVPLPEEERARLKRAQGAPPEAEATLTLRVVLPFGGGVTLDWLVQRIQEWEAVLMEHRRTARRAERERAPLVRETVH
jgi:hypothetical protein